MSLRVKQLDPDGLFLLEILSGEKKNFNPRKAIDSELTRLRALQTDTLACLGAVSMHMYTNNLKSRPYLEGTCTCEYEVCEETNHHHSRLAMGIKQYLTQGFKILIFNNLYIFLK